MTSPARRRALLWILQLALGLALAVFVWRTLTANWAQFRDLKVDIHLRVVPLVAAVAVTFFSYGLQIEAWRRVLLGWSQRVAFRPAAYVWTVSNLGRYVPGKVWTVAGLVLLARRAGVSGGAATASGIAVQAMAVGTGTALAALTATGSVSSYALLGVGVVGTAVVFVLVWRPLGHRLMQLFGRDLPALPLRTAFVAAAATLVSWVTHGLSFWLLAHGVVPGVALSPWTAVSAFSAAYIIGLVSMFAPGGLGVREAMFLAILTPSCGAGGAVTLAVASRLFLTLMELGAAGIGVVMGTHARGMSSV